MLQQREWGVTIEGGGETAWDGKYMMPTGITADGQGHLFVTDENNRCIPTYSVTGEHQGVLLEEGEQGLGESQSVRWSDARSSLVTAHRTKDGSYISVISLQ